MKTLIYACAFLAAAAVAQHTATRILKADVLRDFPKTCFASTLCRVFEPTEKWPLIPYCGESTCMKNETGLFEIVNDCGPRIKETPGCTVELPDAKEPVPFPHCCPKVTCQEGVNVTYYTPDELKELLAKEAAALPPPDAPSGPIAAGP